MARVLSRTLALTRRLDAHPVDVRRRRHHTRKRAELLEVEASPSLSPSPSPEGNLARRLEDAIEGAIARMAEPEWAPFRPGTSYFAPRRGHVAAAAAAEGLVALVKRGRVAGQPRALSGDEARAVAATSRGWPCSTYFIDGCFPDEVESSRQEAASTENK